MDISEKIKAAHEEIESLEALMSDPDVAGSPEFKADVEKGLSEKKSELAALEKEVSEATDAAAEEAKKAEEEVKKAEAEVKAAERAAKEAESSSEKAKAEKKKKNAKADLEKAEEEAEEAEKAELQAKVDKKEIALLAKQVEKAKKAWGGRRSGAGRKISPNKVVVVKGKRGGHRPGAGRKAGATAVKKAKVAGKALKAGEKTVTAFGQKLTWKTEAEFCAKMKRALIERRTKYKTTKKRTKPVFSRISSKVADAVAVAVGSISKEEINKNPKGFKSKIVSLERSAHKFLSDFKAILGSDYKQSHIAREFGEVERTIKSIVSKAEKAHKESKKK